MSNPLSLGISDRALLVLAWSIIALALVCVGFAVAAVLLRLRNERLAARWGRFEQTWEPAVLEVMAGGPAEPLVASIRPADVPYFVDYLSRVAKEIRGVDRERVAALGRPFLDHSRQELRSPVAEERARAVASLGLLGGPSEIGLVIAALDDPARLVAMSAARSLTRRRDPDHAAAVLAHLDRLHHWRPGFLAAMLAALGPDAAGLLRETLENDQLPNRVRAVASAALLRLSDPAAAESAIRAIESTDDPEVVAAALRLLAKVGNASHLPTVRSQAEVASDIIRVAAFRALAELGDAEDLPRLQQGLEDESVWVAEYAARGLARGPGRGLLAAHVAAGAPRARLAREALAEAT